MANDFYLIYSTNNTSHLWYICRKTNTEGKVKKITHKYPGNWQQQQQQQKVLYHHFGEIYIRMKDIYLLGYYTLAFINADKLDFVKRSITPIIFQDNYVISLWSLG